MVNMRNNHCNGQDSKNQTSNANNNPHMEQIIATQNQLMQTVLQTLNHLQPNQQVHQQQLPPPPQSKLGEFLRTRPTTFSQTKDPMEAEDWLKSIEKNLKIAQCTDRENVLFVVHQLFGTVANWWETYCNSHPNVGSITWNDFKAQCRTHYVPRGTIKLKKEFADLRQGNMTVNEYLNLFILRNQVVSSLV
jgi:hypothetical protein